MDKCGQQYVTAQGGILMATNCILCLARGSCAGVGVGGRVSWWKEWMMASRWVQYAGLRGLQ
eukprot:2094958-Prorocentrum_lima.AAC.1